MGSPLPSVGDRLDEAVAWRAERTLSQSLTLQYDNILFMVEPSAFAQAAIGKRVEVVDFPDGRLEVRFEGRTMPYRTFDKLWPHSKLGWMTPKDYASALSGETGDRAAQPGGSARTPLATHINEGSNYDRTLVMTG